MPDYAEFDAADYLDNDETVAEFLAVAAEDPDPAVFLAAVAAVARARGMTKVASEAGLGRVTLHKALTPGAHPRYETVQKILRSLGLRMTFTVAH
ncbi:addiction module antidote protein [Burkholderia gladioli]|jgi:probable addiction module antidote protein|uniref:Addiction module antidote protein n=1 Tax=Burkholderia gladioli TaxID=28095 RepID=A0A095WD14_BURGA|nr:MULTISPECIES: addiction module antidote protein [Burkholderia]AJW96687.1 putative integron cassette protein [Burkholderia gladioli]ASD83014.1 putative addiction module antidote protein [Burkholderia gladioli pv. gladioli]ATF89658.1 putative addiction module antidote protein [Burkholderia gladioli pv. gladioli]AWY50447.1 putative addiction module antidote protein [Burkholderia gladioli pv. gladioli]AYQ89750.1 putative addiction module antidote protein [Burkholderia gladioli]